MASHKRLVEYNDRQPFKQPFPHFYALAGHDLSKPVLTKQEADAITRRALDACEAGGRSECCMSVVGEGFFS